MTAPFHFLRRLRAQRFLLANLLIGTLLGVLAPAQAQDYPGKPIRLVIPYPPGFPIMVPGQVIQADTIAFMRKLDVKEIHGYHAAHGLKLLRPDVLGTAKKTAAE